MIIGELVDVFKRRYQLECLKRRVSEIILNEKLIVLLLSETVGDIQKSFGVLEVSLPISLIAGTDKYNLSASIMTVKTVMFGDNRLIEKSTAWMECQIALSSTPNYYSILYLNAIPKIWIYPNPVSAGILTINYNPNFNFYSPSSIQIETGKLAVDDADEFASDDGGGTPVYVPGDFGSFFNGVYTGNTVFPTQYDKLILLGMLKQLFKELEEDYLKESILLRAKQFNGGKLNVYKMDGCM
jgi:hypothetical protein